MSKEAELTVDGDGEVEGSPLLISLIQSKMLLERKKDFEIVGSPWCG